MTSNEIFSILYCSRATLLSFIVAFSDAVADDDYEKYPFRLDPLNYRSAETSIPLAIRTHWKTILYMMGALKYIYTLDRIYLIVLNACTQFDEINELVTDK